MSHVHLISGTDTLRLKGLVYPQTDELDLGLAVGTSRGGDIYVSRKSAPALTLSRSFTGVRDEDFDQLRDWHIRVSEGPRNSFSFIDGDGSSRTVRWINGLGDWRKDSSNRWSGFMKLRVEDFQP